jgi:hypothetical protein
MRYVEGNLSNGQFKLMFFNEKFSMIESQKHVVSSFFEFADNFIKTYGIELCFEKFDLENQFVLTNQAFEPYLLQTHHLKIDYTPIFSNTKIIQTDKIDLQTVLDFVESKTKTVENQNFLTGLSHLSFQSGLFRLPTKIAARKFYLEKENKIQSAYEYECVSDEWFESPLNKPFMFPPFELNFSREPYSKAWSLLISLNWDMYSPKNKTGFDLLSEKISLLIKSGWICEFSSFQNDLNSLLDF